MTRPLYSIGTWDADEQAFTPQAGLSVPSLNIDRGTLRQAMRQLRAMGYTCHYVAGGCDSDASVFIERTDGEVPRHIVTPVVQRELFGE